MFKAPGSQKQIQSFINEEQEKPDDKAILLISNEKQQELECHQENEQPKEQEAIDQDKNMKGSFKKKRTKKKVRHIMFSGRDTKAKSLRHRVDTKDTTHNYQNMLRDKNIPMVRSPSQLSSSFAR